MSPMPLIDCLATTAALAEVFSDAGVLAGDAGVRRCAGARAAHRGPGACGRRGRHLRSGAPRRIRCVGHREGWAKRRHARDPVGESVACAGGEIDPAAPRTCTGARPARTSRTRRWCCSCAGRTASSRLITSGSSRPCARFRSSRRHDHAGRTLLQPATPITFGLKVAVWTAPIARSWRRLDRPGIRRW